MSTYLVYKLVIILFGPENSFPVSGCLCSFSNLFFSTLSHPSFLYPPMPYPLCADPIRLYLTAKHSHYFSSIISYPRHFSRLHHPDKPCLNFIKLQVTFGREAGRPSAGAHHYPPTPYQRLCYSEPTSLYFPLCHTLFVLTINTRLIGRMPALPTHAPSIVPYSPLILLFPIQLPFLFHDSLPMSADPYRPWLNLSSGL